VEGAWEWGRIMVVRLLGLLLLLGFVEGEVVSGV
jgi:hypothetical protein